MGVSCDHGLTFCEILFPESIIGKKRSNICHFYFISLAFVDDVFKVSKEYIGSPDCFVFSLYPTLAQYLDQGVN